MKIKYFYVVRKGRRTGIFTTYAECEAQVKYYPGAIYKIFSTLAAAEYALKYGWNRSNKMPSNFNNCKVEINVSLPSSPCLCTDGSKIKLNSIEYRTVEYPSRKELFRYGPYPNGSNNIAEFLGLVATIRYCKHHSIELPIYTDSSVALIWVKK